MDAAEFVAAVRAQAYRKAVSRTQSLLDKPPGRRPDPNLVKLSAWFGQLAETDQQAALGVAELAARLAVFSLLAIMDGVRAIEDSEEKGTFELRFIKGDVNELVNDPHAEQLHDLFVGSLSDG